MYLGRIHLEKGTSTYMEPLYLPLEPSVKLHAIDPPFYTALVTVEPKSEVLSYHNVK
jgi:hypothetical protein